MRAPVGQVAVGVAADELETLAPCFAPPHDKLDALARFAAQRRQIAQTPDFVKLAAAIHVRQRCLKRRQIAMNIAENRLSHRLVSLSVEIERIEKMNRRVHRVLRVHRVNQGFSLL